MATWSNQSRNSASFSNQSRNSAVFTNANHSDQTTYGELDNTVLGELGNDSIFKGKPVGDWANSDVVGTVWQNQTRNT